MFKCFECLNNNRYYCIGAAILVAMLISTKGCESRVSSILHPEQKVTRSELQIEIDFLIAQSKVRFGELDKHDEVKAFVLEQLQVFGKTGSINPAGLVNAAITIGAISFGLDRNRKYKTGGKLPATATA